MDAFRELLRRGIAGIAVKTVFYKTLPADMLRLADAMNVPVFAYHAASMEEIILAAHSYMLAKEQRELAAMRLDAMLGFGRAPSAVAESVRALDAMLYPHCVASFSTPREGGALNLGQKMPVPCFQMGNIPHFSLIMTGFCSFIPQRMQSALQARKMRCFAHMNHAAWRLPHGGPGFPPRAMHTIFSMPAIRQSLYSNRVCQCFEKPRLRYGTLGVYRFLPALLEDKSVLAEYRAALTRLRCFEEESGIAMLDTLSAYAAAHGSVEQAAKRIYQHPNTVRNRVKKARALLALNDDWYEQIFILMGLYALEQT